MGSKGASGGGEAGGEAVRREDLLRGAMICWRAGREVGRQSRMPQDSSMLKQLGAARRSEIHHGLTPGRSSIALLCRAAEDALRFRVRRRGLQHVWPTSLPPLHRPWPCVHGHSSSVHRPRADPSSQGRFLIQCSSPRGRRFIRHPVPFRPFRRGTTRAPAPRPTAARACAPRRRCRPP